MAVETPHLAATLQITRDGAVVVEQDTPEDVAACVERIAVCPLGFRDDLPQFGVPEITFKEVPLDLEPWEEAVEAWEPRATLSTSEEAEALEQGLRRINVTVNTV